MDENEVPEQIEQIEQDLDDDDVEELTDEQIELLGQLVAENQVDITDAG